MLSFLFLFLILLFFKLYRFFYFTLHLFDVFSCCLGFFVFQLHCFVLVVLFHLYHSIVSIPTPSCCSSIELRSLLFLLECSCYCFDLSLFLFSGASFYTFAKTFSHTCSLSRSLLWR